MQRLSFLVLVLGLLLALSGLSGASAARLLRGLGAGAQQPLSGAPRGLMTVDGKASKDGDSWGSRDWPAARQVATSSGRGGSWAAQPVAAAYAGPSRSYGYASNAQAYPMGGGMSAPIYDGWSNRG